MQLLPVIAIMALGSAKFVFSSVAETTEDAFVMPSEDTPTGTTAPSENTTSITGFSKVFDNFDPTFMLLLDFLAQDFEVTTRGACIPKPWLASTLLRLNESRSACVTEWQLLKDAHWDVIRAYKNAVLTLHAAAATCPETGVCRAALGTNSTDSYVNSILGIHRAFETYEQTVDQVVPVLTAPLEDASPLPCIAGQESFIYYYLSKTPKDLNWATMYVNSSVCSEAQQKQMDSDAAIKKLEAAAADFGMDVGVAMAEIVGFTKEIEKASKLSGSRLVEEDAVGELKMALEELEKACGRMILDTTSMNACDFRVRVENAVDAVCSGNA